MHAQACANSVPLPLYPSSYYANPSFLAFFYRSTGSRWRESRRKAAAAGDGATSSGRTAATASARGGTSSMGGGTGSGYTAGGSSRGGYGRNGGSSRGASDDEGGGGGGGKGGSAFGADFDDFDILNDPLAEEMGLVEFEGGRRRRRRKVGRRLGGRRGKGKRGRGSGLSKVRSRRGPVRAGNSSCLLLMHGCVPVPHDPWSSLPLHAA